MFFSRHRVALVSALALAALVGSLGLTTVPASASAVPASTVPAAVGKIICKDDLCIQTQSVNTSTCYAVVAAWANTAKFYGHFEMINEITGGYANSSQQWWYAGGKSTKFTADWTPVFTFRVIAWKDTNGSYSAIGTVNFGIDPNSSACS
jgi:hypothetical protein